MWIRVVVVLAVLVGLPLLALQLCQQKIVVRGQGELWLLPDAPDDVEVWINDERVVTWTRERGGRAAQVSPARRARFLVRRGDQVLFEGRQSLAPNRRYLLYLGGPLLWKSVKHYSVFGVAMSNDPGRSEPYIRFDGQRRRVDPARWPGSDVEDLTYAVAVWSKPHLLPLGLEVYLPHHPLPRSMEGVAGATAADVNFLRRMTPAHSAATRASLLPLEEESSEGAPR